MKKRNLPALKKNFFDFFHTNFNAPLKKMLAAFIATMSILSSSASTDCLNYGNGQAQNIVYSVNGATVTTLSGNISSGDVVNVCFTLSAGADSTIFSLVSYKAPGASFNSSTAYLQTVFDLDSKVVYGSGTFCLSVTVPSCDFQVDFVTGCPIYQFGASGSSDFYSAQGRLIDGDNGGSGTCNCVAQANAGADFSLNCAITSVHLNGSTYVHHPIINWQATLGGNISAGVNTLTPTITMAGTYILSVTDSLGCVATDTVVVTGHTNVLAAGQIGPDQSNCGPFVPSTLLSIADATINSGETVQYQWLQSPVNVLNTVGNPYWSAISGAHSPTYNPGLVSTTTYYVRCSRTVGCTYLGSTTETNIIGVTILPTVTVNLGSDVSINCGGSVTLDAGNSGMTYLWNTGATTQTISASANGTYYVSVTNSDNCSGSDTINVTNNGSVSVELGNDTVLCAGASLVLNAGNSGSSILWSTGVSTQTISVSASGTYSVSVSNGSCSASDAIHVTILPPVTVNLGNDTTINICHSPLVLNAGNSGMTYLWSTGVTTQTLSVSSSGTYSVTVTNSGGCNYSDVINVTVNSGTLAVNLGNDTTLCAGGNILLNAGHTGLNFLWSTGVTTQTITASASGTYSVTVTDGSCSASDAINVTVLAPLVVNLGNDTTLCAGGSILLNAGNAGLNFSWNTGVTTQTITASASGTYSVSVTNGSCSASDAIHVTILAPLVVNLGNDTALCAGTNFSLDAGNAGASYLWSTGATTRIITVSASGTYSVTVSNGSCSTTDAIHITILPAVTVNLGNDTTINICHGPLVLNAGNSGMTYLWSTGAVSQTISVSASGTYSVTVTNSGGCHYSDVINVTVNPGTLAVNLGNDTTLCAGGSIVLNAGHAGLSFAWSTGVTTQTITASASGTYSVTVTDGSCSASDAIHVTVLAPLVVNLGNDTTVTLCTGHLTLDAGNSGMTYLWNTGAISQTINVNASGTYSVMVTNSGGCHVSDVINVTVNTGHLSINIGNDTTYSTCTHETLTLNTGVSGGIYVWSTGATTQTITVHTTGIYSVSVTDNLGCVATDTISITIHDNTVDVNLGNDTTVCGCILLNAGNPSANITWCSGQNYPIINACWPGMYCVAVSNGVCTGRDTIHITINPPPVVNLGHDTVLVSGTLTLNAGHPGATYHWSTGATTQTIIVNATGTYYVTITDIYGCTASDTINISILNGIAGYSTGVSSLTVFPNPADNKSFALNFEAYQEGNVEIHVHNQLGMIVYSEKLSNFKGTYNKPITLSNCAAGIYFATILRGKQTNIIKVALD